MTAQQKANIEAIVSRSKVMTALDRAEAARNGDIGRGIRIANNEAEVDAFLRRQGIEVKDPTMSDPSPRGFILIEERK